MSAPTMQIFWLAGFSWGIAAIVHYMLRSTWKLNEAAAQSNFDAAVSIYRKTFGSSESGGRFLNSIGASSASRKLDSSRAGIEAGLGAASVTWGILGARPITALKTGLLTGMFTAVSNLFSKAGINRGKTPEQVQMEEKIAIILNKYQDEKRVYEIQISWIWVLALGVSAFVVVAHYMSGA